MPGKTSSLFLIRPTLIVHKWKDANSDTHQVLRVYKGCPQLMESIVFRKRHLKALTNFISFKTERPLTSGKPTSTNKVKMLVCFSWKGSCLMQWSVKAAITSCHCAEAFRERRMSAMELAQSSPIRLQSKSRLH